MNKQKEQAAEGDIKKWEEPVMSNHSPVLPLISLLTYSCAV